MLLICDGRKFYYVVDIGILPKGVGDIVQCYHWGGGVRNWERGDDPMLEHVRWFPHCEHIKPVKGKEYIAAVQRGEEPTEIDNVIFN